MIRRIAGFGFQGTTINVLVLHLSFLLLVAMPGAPSSFLFLVVRPGAPSSVLAPGLRIDKEHSNLSFQQKSEFPLGVPERSAHVEY